MKKWIVLIMLVVAVSLSAHEYVLIAYHFILQKGDRLELHLFVADGFNVELERPLQKSITRHFGIINENGKTDLLATAKEGSLPVIDTIVNFNGQGLIYMDRDYAGISLPNNKFRDYLREDNIENITSIDTSKQLQTERYMRYLKALIQSNEKKSDTTFKTNIGQTFEIVLLDNPYQANLNDWIRAQILFRGTPLRNKVMTARNRIGNLPCMNQYARTNDQGICQFKLERDGDWFIHGTHLLKSADLKKSDWESFWVSYSFGVKF